VDPYIQVTLALLALVVAVSFWIVIVPRRCHDLGYSGFAILWLFFPGVNFIFVIILFTKKGTGGPNRYGPRPQERAALWTYFREEHRQRLIRQQALALHSQKS
jgi:uncharacterized membrane protein YhaH (DUF805 family)